MRREKAPPPRPRLSVKVEAKMGEEGRPATLEVQRRVKRSVDT